MISARSFEEIGGDVASRLPDGWAWDKAPASNTRRSLHPLAMSVAGFEASAIAQLLEGEPDTAEIILDGYERVLGPDTCIGDPQTLTLAQRRASVTARWIATWGASPAELIEQAAGYGVAVTLKEFRRTPAGVLRAGAARVCHPEEFTVVVTLPAANVVPFKAGVSRAGDPLGHIQRATVIECVLRRAAPARCVLVFDYSTTIEFRLDDTPMDQGAPLD